MCSFIMFLNTYCVLRTEQMVKKGDFRVLLMTFLLKEKANRKKEANTDLSQVGRLSV